jgi:hypothetical protein
MLLEATEAPPNALNGPGVRRRTPDVGRRACAEAERAAAHMKYVATSRSRGRRSNLRGQRRTVATRLTEEETTVTGPTPHLSFPGTARQALTFYQELCSAASWS